MHIYTRTRLLRHPQTGGKESLDHSFRRTESLSSVGSQRSLRSFMSATPSRGLSVRQGRHASSPGDGDVSDAPFEFPKRLSAEELQQQLAYLEQALRDADRRNTGKLKRQVRSSFALLKSNSCDFCFSRHGLCASKKTPGSIPALRKRRCEECACAWLSDCLHHAPELAFSIPGSHFPE